VKNTPFF